MKRLFILFFFCALSLPGRAQITALGITAGFKSDFSNAYALQVGSFVVEIPSMGTGPGNIINEQNLYRQFGAFVEHRLLSRFTLSHQINLYHVYLQYIVVGSPEGNKSNTMGVFTTKYNALIRLYSKHGFRAAVGAGLDFNFVIHGSASDFQFDDQDLNELLAALPDTFNPVVINTSAEIGYRAGLLDVSVRYSQGLTLFTRSLNYQGESYPLPIRSSGLFFNLGVLIYNKSLREQKRK